MRFSARRATFNLLQMLGSKEQLFEQEQQMSVIKARYREAQDEIDELRNQLDDQTAQLDDYRNKVRQRLRVGRCV